MPTINRDRDIVRHILRYCEQVDTAHKDFGHSKERFEANTTYQNAISMCILQIGELIGRLSEDFKKTNLETPWHKIRGMRNYVAHEYGSMDFEVVWYVSTNSIADVLARFVSLQFVFLKLTKITYNIRLKFSGGGILVARNTDGGSGHADHTGYGPEDHYNASTVAKHVKLKGAPSIAAHTFKEVVGGA